MCIQGKIIEQVTMSHRQSSIWVVHCNIALGGKIILLPADRNTVLVLMVYLDRFSTTRFFSNLISIRIILTD